MKVTQRILSFCLFFGLASQSIVPAETEVGKYEVLGLRLGMTAKEAENVITARFHVSPGRNGYLMLPGNARFVPGRPFVSDLSVDAGEARLILNFAEAVPGEGKGPEALWSVNYTPMLRSTADKQAFVARVIEKYGEPSRVFDKQEYFWADRAYDSPLAFNLANVPQLHLTTYVPVLVMQNPGTPRHMNEVFNSRQTTSKPPL